MTERQSKSRHDLVRELVDEVVVAWHDEVSWRDPVTKTLHVRRRSTPLLVRVRLLAAPGAEGPKGGERKYRPNLPAGRAPTSAAFDLAAELEALARRLETAAREALGFEPRPRPSTSAASVEALRALPSLLYGLDAGHDVVDRSTRELSSWHRKARLLLGDPRVTRWTPLRGHVCPYCELPSIRQRPRDDALVCMTPDCVDAAGKRPTWPANEWAGSVIGPSRLAASSSSDGDRKSA